MNKFAHVAVLVQYMGGYWKPIQIILDYKGEATFLTHDKDLYLWDKVQSVWPHVKSLDDLLTIGETNASRS